jgi:hypothetical protein
MLSWFLRSTKRKHKYMRMSVSQISSNYIVPEDKWKSDKSLTKLKTTSLRGW